MNQTLRFAIFLLLFSCTFFACQRDKSMKMNNPRNIHGVWSYKKVFGDINDLQLTAAHKYGITPISTREEAEEMTKKLKEIKTCDLYVVDELTHSIPFLVPGACNLLDAIGQNFLDSLENKGLNPYKVTVTSVTRTKSDVERLRRGNLNATDNSCHLYGTTVDICYNRYKTVEPPEGPARRQVRNDSLKWILSEVLRDFRNQNRCYIKYEVKQGCFHLTVK